MNRYKKASAFFSRIWIMIFIVTALILTQAWAGDSHEAVVMTLYGKLKGYVSQDVIIWKGVPYAKPPVGDLRWRAPLAPDQWSGVRDASLPASKCTQLVTTKDWIRTGQAEGCEDCLYLDIYRPLRHGYRHERLPVYVWIHGGSNNFGSGRDYDGSELASRSNVVVVVVQYRLGPMGWFFHPAVQTGGADKFSDSGNFGTLDHAKALKWIHHNIEGFGGDPHTVLITGESAGGHNVMNQVVSSVSKGLFHRAMSQSGGMTTKPAAYARNLANSTIEMILRYKEGLTPAQAAQRRLDMETAGTLDAYLRSIDSGTFFLAILKTSGTIGTYDGIEDGTVLPVGGWIPAIRAGNYNKVPIILGSNEYESKSFMPLYGPTVKAYFGQPSGTYTWFSLIDVLKGKTKPDGTPLTLNDVLPAQSDRDLYEIAGYYGGRNWKAKFVDTVTRELSLMQKDVYAYLFKWGGVGSGPSPFDSIYGAGHAAEIFFFFGADQGLFGYPFVPENEAGRKALQQAMMKYLANFAHTGNPNQIFPCPPGWTKNKHHSCLPRWKRWSNAQGASKAIIFDADFEQAKIEMMNEEVTVEGVMAELIEAIKALPPAAQAAAKFFQWQAPW